MPKGLAALVAVVLVSTVAVSAAAAAAGPHRDADRHYRVTAVAGSASFLVYEKFRLQNSEPVNPGQLFVIKRSGTHHLLGPVRTRDIDFSLSGHTLEYEENARNFPVELINLKTGTARQYSTTNIGPLASPVSAAPDGFVAEVLAATKPRHFLLKKESTNGTVSSLGDPFPNGAHFYITVNAKSYVAFATGESGGAIRTARFSHPKQVLTLLSPRPGHRANQCGDPTASYVACRTYSGSSGSRAALRLFTLTGHVVAHTTKHCQGSSIPPVPLGHTAVWLGCPNDRRLWQLTSTGRTTASRRTFAHNRPINALHEIVLSTPSRMTLIALTGATATPHTIAQTT